MHREGKKPSFHDLKTEHDKRSCQSAERKDVCEPMLGRLSSDGSFSFLQPLGRQELLCQQRLRRTADLGSKQLHLTGNLAKIIITA